VALQAYLGLRPSECQGLAWDCVDLQAGEIHLRRGVVRNVIGDLKTKGSVATLPAIEPVLSLLQLVGKTNARTWVFENSVGRPADLKAIVWNHIKPAIKTWNESHGPENHTI
jgi:integrase